MKKITVLIAEDYKLIREGWAMKLRHDTRFTIVGSCGTDNDTLSTINRYKPDIVLYSVHYDFDVCIKSVQKIAQDFPASKVVIVSCQKQLYEINKMIAMGARGFVSMMASSDELKEAIVEVNAGSDFICKPKSKNWQWYSNRDNEYQIA